MCDLLNFIIAFAVSFTFIRQYKDIIVNGTINQKFLIYVAILSVALSIINEFCNIIQGRKWQFVYCDCPIRRLIYNSLGSFIAVLFIKLIFENSSLPRSLPFFMSIFAIYLYIVY